MDVLIIGGIILFIAILALFSMEEDKNKYKNADEKMAVAQEEDNKSDWEEAFEVNGTGKVFERPGNIFYDD